MSETKPINDEDLKRLDELHASTNFPDATQTLIVWNSLPAIRARIAEQEDESPGTPMGRLNAIGEFTERECGHNPASSKGAEGVLCDAFMQQKATIAQQAERIELLEISNNALHAEACLHEGRAKELAERIKKLEKVCRCVLECDYDIDDLKYWLPTLQAALVAPK